MITLPMLFYKLFLIALFLVVADLTASNIYKGQVFICQVRGIGAAQAVYSTRGNIPECGIPDIQDRI